MKVALLFSGQGAQFVGMGKDFYEKSPVAKKIFDEADKILGTSLTSICFEGPEETLKKTENTQPAVLLMSYVAFKLLEENGIKSDTFAGFSLGEYSALTAAGVINFSDALKIVKKRGLIIENAVPAGKGGMAAILGLDDAKIEDICKNIDGIVVPVNYNCPGQLVISGEKEAVLKACDIADAEGAMRTVVLNVSGPFHSPLLEGASLELKKELEMLKFNALNGKKVYSNVNASLHTDENIKAGLVKQLFNPVQWHKCIKTLIDEGYDTFIECGPGKTLRGFMRSIDKKMTALNVQDMASLEEVLTKLKQ